MNNLIVCASVSHGNTRRIAEAMAAVLDADILAPQDVDPVTLSTFDTVGFGSGVYHLNVHPALRELVRALPSGQRGNAFVFATSGLPEPPFRPYLRRFAARLGQKGFRVLDSFHCRGLDTWGPFGLVGGIRRGRPDAADLAAARDFARRLSPDRLP